MIEQALYVKPTALAAFRRPALSMRRGSIDPSTTLQNHQYSVESFFENEKTPIKSNDEETTESMQL